MTGPEAKATSIDGPDHDNETLREVAAEQLTRELAERLSPFDELARAAGIGPVFTAQALGHLQTADLVTDIDPDTAQAILAALWPASVEPHWWQTPLGRLIAAPLADATPDAQVVKISEAARMLNMSHSRVVQLADDTGALTRNQGGVTLASVYRRIANPGRPGRPGWRPTPEGASNDR